MKLTTILSAYRQTEEKKYFFACQQGGDYRARIKRNERQSNALFRKLTVALSGIDLVSLPEPQGESEKE